MGRAANKLFGSPSPSLPAPAPKKAVTPIKYQPISTKVGLREVGREIPRATGQVATDTVRAIARPFVRAGINVLNIGRATQKLFGGDIAGANRAATSTYNVPLLGKEKPVTGPVEAAGVGADIGLTLAGGMVTKAAGRVAITRHGFKVRPSQQGKAVLELGKKIEASARKAYDARHLERPERAVDAFRSVESRMQRSSPQGKQVASLFQESDTRFLPRMGQRTLQLSDAKLNKVKNPLDITDALEGRTKPDALNPAQRKVFDVIDEIRTSVAKRSQETGLQIRTSKGGLTPFKPRENYYPHYIPDTKHLAKGSVRDEVLKAAVKRKDFKSLQEATDALDKYVQFVKSGGKDHLDFFANRLVQQEAAKVRTPMVRSAQEQSALQLEHYNRPDLATKLRKLDLSDAQSVDEAKATVLKALKDAPPELQQSGTNYFDSMKQVLDFQTQQKPLLGLPEARGKVLRFFKASRQQRYGNLERAREIDLPFYDPNPQRVLPKYVASTERRLADAEVLGPNLEKVDQLLGTVKHPDVQKTLRQLVKVARRGNDIGEPNLAKVLDATRGISTLRLSPLSGITNLGQSANSFMAADTKSFLKGATKAIFTKEGRRLPIESGNLAESVLRTIQQQAGGDSRAVGAYLKVIGFTGTERFNRRVASNVGAEYAKGLYKQLLKNPANKIARQELQALELNADDLLKTGFNKDAVLRAAKVFTDKTQFRSREIDLPAMSSTTALGKNMSQFKTFAFQQSRFVAKQTLDLFKTNPQRALRNIGILATVYPLTGEAIADLRAFIQGKKRETTGIQRYIENAAQVGAFGILYDAVKSTSFKGGLAEFLAGPTIGGAINNVENITQSVQGGFSDAEKRDFLRQVPGAGPVVANRLLPADPLRKNPNVRSEKEDVVSDPTFGDVAIPDARFNVDAKEVSLTKTAEKEFNADMVRALTKTIQRVSQAQGDSEAKKKLFKKEWNKAKAAVKKDWLSSGKLNPDTIYGPKRDPLPESTYTTISKYGRGVVQDPEGTLRALFTPERLEEVTRGTAVLTRQKFLSLLDKGDKNSEVDHVVPLWLGGTNDKSNLRVLSKEKHDAKTKVESKIRKALEDKRINRTEARDLLQGYVKTGKEPQLPEKTSLLNRVLGIKEASAATIPAPKDSTDKVAAVIATIEGYKKKGTIADRQKNPGNLRFVGQKGASKGTKNFAIFKTHQEGWNALRRQIQLDASRGLTLKQFIYKYAPPQENNTARYLATLASKLGASPNAKLSQVIK